jgi:hypothetical protein
MYEEKMFNINERNAIDVWVAGLSKATILKVVAFFSIVCRKSDCESL